MSQQTQPYVVIEPLFMQNAPRTILAQMQYYIRGGYYVQFSQ